MTQCRGLWNAAAVGVAPDLDSMGKATNAALEHLRGELRHSQAQYATIVRALHRKVQECESLQGVVRELTAGRARSSSARLALQVLSMPLAHTGTPGPALNPNPAISHSPAPLIFTVPPTPLSWRIREHKQPTAAFLFGTSASGTSLRICTGRLGIAHTVVKLVCRDLVVCP